MLVLSRRHQEAIAIGGAGGQEHSVKITVLEIGGGKVRLGFEAISELFVHRWEVWERIQLENGRGRARAG